MLGRSILKLLAILGLMLFGPAPARGADTIAGVVSRGDVMKHRQYQTYGAQTLYVDPLGNDGNGCVGTGTAACLTIQGAVNKLPKHLRHLITINVAAGNYAGFEVPDFVTEPGTTGAGLTIAGTLANSTLASGAVTGTFDSAALNSCHTFSTATLAGAGWTVNDLAGRFVTLTGGTGAGQTFVIDSNTATVITIAGLWSANGFSTPGATTTFAIQDSATHIISGVTVPQGLMGATSQPAESGANGILIDGFRSGTAAPSYATAGLGNPSTGGGIGLWLKNFAMDADAGSNVQIYGRNSTGVLISNNQFAAMTTGAASVMANNGADWAVSANAASLRAKTVFYSQVRFQYVGGYQLLSNNRISGGIGVSGHSRINTNSVPRGSWSITRNSIHNADATTIADGAGAVGLDTSVDSDVNCNLIDTVTAGYGISIGNTNENQPGRVRVYGNNVLNAAMGGVLIRGNLTVSIGTNPAKLTGSGNGGWGITIRGGPVVSVDSTVADITGATGDMTLDGVGTLSYTDLGTAGVVRRSTTGSTFQTTTYGD